MNSPAPIGSLPDLCAVTDELVEAACARHGPEFADALEHYSALRALHRIFSSVGRDAEHFDDAHDIFLDLSSILFQLTCTQLNFTATPQVIDEMSSIVRILSTRGS